MLDQGLLAPEEAMRELVQNAVEQASLQTGGFVLEGFPRTIPQLLTLMRWSPVATYIWLDVPMLICALRLQDRNRVDDHPDAIAKKMHFFDNSTQPMLDALSEVGGVHRVNGEGSIHAVYERIRPLI